MTLENKLISTVAKAISELFGADVPEKDIQIQNTRKEFEGELTLVVFPLVRYAKKSPEKTAEAIGDYLKDKIAQISNFNVVKGFLNLEIRDNFWLEQLQNSLSVKDFGNLPAASKEKVMVEYSSPNTNKPLHLGHLRNNFLGFSVARILEAAGHEVVKVQIINDRGIHICKSMLAWQKFGKGETPDSTGMKGDHLVGKYYVLFEQELKKQAAKLIEEEDYSEEEARKYAPIMQEAQEMLLKWEAKETEVYDLWQTMNSWVYEGFEVTYNNMGVTFDKLYFESDTWLVGKNEVLKGVESGAFYKKKDASVWVDLTDAGLDEKLLLRKDGTAVYMTQDIGTAILRFREYPKLSRLIYTVGNEQEYHFKVLFLILQKLGFEWAKECYHLSYGMVELPEGKMKSREGTVVDADDLMLQMSTTAREITEELGKLDGIPNEEKEELYQQIGMASLKYFLLKVDPRKSMLFDPRESLDFNGNTGPFIQYAYARINSILRNYKGETGFNEAVQLSHLEKTLILKIYQYPNLVEEAAANYSPALLANYIYDMVKDFNSFYQSTPILKQEDVNLVKFRVSLAMQTGRVIEHAMALLGIEVPERM